MTPKLGARWKDPWFNGLGATAKIIALYIEDNCDAAGVWPADWREAEFRINFAKPINREAVWEDFKKLDPSRVWQLNGGQKLWVTDYIVRHYRTGLNAQHLPHIPAYRSLTANGLLDTFRELYPDYVVKSEKVQLRIAEITHEKAGRKNTVSGIAERIEIIDASMAAYRLQTAYDPMLMKDVITPGAQSAIRLLIAQKEKLLNFQPIGGTGGNRSNSQVEPTLVNT